MVELRQYQEVWQARIDELENALRTMKPEEKIIEKEKIVYYEDEDRIMEMQDKLDEMTAENGIEIG